MKKFLFLLSIILISSTVIHAQFYIGPFVGFKASGLTGAWKGQQNGFFGGGNQIADASSTGLNAGFTAGYQVIPPDVAGGLYKLDLDLDVSWSSFSYYENAYNSMNGTGSFVGQGFTGGGTNVFSFDIMPINRFHFNNFILSPFVGIGFGINLLLNSDVTAGAGNIGFGGTQTYSGSSDLKMGLLIFYGTLFNVSSVVKPFIQFKHLIPFGSETELTAGSLADNNFGFGGVQNNSQSIADVPGYFNMVAGVRFYLQ